jgi:hypothetical protein
MLARFQQIESANNLREYVNKTICGHYQLQAGAFNLTERVLLRGDKPCGIYFCLHGPRLAKFTAIWDADSNQVLFYGSRGERFLKIQWVETQKSGLAAA